MDKAASLLDIALFGPMQVSVQGKPLPRLHSRKGLYLLALLCLRRERPVERAWLAGLLWPDSAEEQALFNLRQCLSDLRKALGEQASRLHSPTMHTLCLDLAGATVDVADFDEAIRHGDNASFERAVALYRGPLLEGCLEEWALPERAELEQVYLQALERLAEDTLQSGEATRAVGYLRRAIALDPLQESLQRALMQALAAAGDYAAVVQVYRDLRLYLHRELHAEPDPQTTALFTHLRRQAQRQAAKPPAEPAPAPSASPPPSRLPYPLSTLIGRDADIDEAAQRLRAGRLVTLTGAGGMGKTRLAIAAAAAVSEEYPDGVFLVDLAPLSDPALVPQAVASVLEVREEPGRSRQESLLDYLQSRALLLVLDNCEHLLESCASLVRALLERCKRLRILATSRQALGLVGEVNWPVRPLAVPDEGAEFAVEKAAVSAWMEYAGIRLFVERAAAVHPAFRITVQNGPAVVQICRHLDGMPLAIELAAARAQALTPLQMLKQLEHRSEFLLTRRRSEIERHRTLRACIDWSYHLLSSELQRFFCALSVFRGGWDLEAAEAVCEEPEALDFLAQLQECSLLSAEETESGEMRYGMLETLREYGAEQLTFEERTDSRAKHARYYEALARQAAEEASGKEGILWFDRVETDYDNMQAALGWALEADPEMSLRMANALGPFWKSRGSHEGYAYAWLERALKTGAGSPGLRTQAMLGMVGIIMNWSYDYAAARVLLAEVVSSTRIMGDRFLLADSLRTLGQVDEGEGDYATAQTHLEEALALFRELEDTNGCSEALKSLGTVAVNEGDYARAQACFEESLALERHGGRSDGTALPLRELGRLSILQGDYARATTLLEESLALYRKRKSGVQTVLRSLGEVALAQGDFHTATARLQESLAFAREIGDTAGCAAAISGLALTALRQEDEEQAAALYRESLHLCVSKKLSGGIANELEGLGKVACARRPARAARLFGAAEALREARRAPRWPADRADYNLHVAALRTRLDAEAFAATWQEGRAMTIEQAVTYALADSEQ